MNLVKQIRMDIWSKALSIALVFATMLIFLPLLFHFSVALKPALKNAADGRLVVQNADFADKNTLALAGDWHFYWQQLLSPSQVVESLENVNTIQAVDGWQAAKQQTYPANGFATYHLAVELTDLQSNLALRIPHIETAYRLYVDDQLVASAGVVADSTARSVPGYRSSIVLLPPNLRSFSITLQVSNYHSIWGGLWSPIVLGQADSIYRLNRDKVALSMFILGALLVSAIHSLLQFYLRPADKASLVFACLCFILFLREMTNEHLYFAFTGVGMSFGAISKLSYLTFYTGFPIALYFIHLSFKREFSRRTAGVFYGIAMIFSIFTVLSPTIYVGHSMFLFQFVALAIMAYAISRLVVAVRRKAVGARMMLIGVLVIGLFALNDILYLTGVIETGRFLGLGIVGFIICQSYAASYRLDSLITSKKDLTIELETRNADLLLLGELLETKVEQRTQQLRYANMELELMANRDKLTDTLNRHGLQQHLQSAFERFRRNGSVFSIVLFDYDNFKNINDTHGHDIGDIVLKTGSNIIKKGIREQDKLARWGGEEFLILLPSTDLEGAKLMAEKLRIEILEHTFSDSKQALDVSVTGGVGQIQPEETFEQLFKRVDNALYKGKHSGKNCIYG